jgi:hypothetical protein
LLYAAIDLVKFNAFGRVGVSSFAPIDSDSSTGSPAADGHGYALYSAGTLGAMDYVVEGLRELPGRKSVIIISENLKLASRHLIERANRASVVIYAIDPRGLQSLGVTAEDDTTLLPPDVAMQEVDHAPRQRATGEMNSREGMAMLARDTGGLFLHNDIDNDLRKALEDGEGYYLIGYHPDASTLDPKTGEFRYRNIKVEVNRPGLTVRARQGFYGRSDRDSRPSFPRTRQGELLHALSSPFGASDIHVRLTPFFTITPQFASIVSGTLFIDPRDLAFTDEPGGIHKAAIDVLAVTFGDNGQAINTSNRTYTVAMEEGDYRDSLDCTPKLRHGN